MSTKTTGGRLLAEMLRAEGVEHVFGIVDGTYLMFLAGCTELGIDIITPRHEATAMHAAGAYARLSGRLGVAMASNGPGVANALSGVAVEQAEGNRVLLITSSRRPQIAYPDRGGAYQCFDQVAVTAPMCKWSATVKSADRLPELAHKALRACHAGRPGVVHLDLPETLINGRQEAVTASPPSRYRRQHRLEPRPQDIEGSIELLRAARLPALHVGSGAIHAGAGAEITELAARLQAPVTTSWAGRGVVPETHPLIFPIVHIDAVNAVRQQADLMLCLGTDLGETDWWGKPPYWRSPAEQRLIQVDIDESILGRNRDLDLAVQADLGAYLQGLLAALHDEERGIRPRTEPDPAVSRLLQMRDEHRKTLDEALPRTPGPLLAGHVAQACCKVMPEEAVAVIDGGSTAVWANFYTVLRRANAQLGTHHFGHLGAGPGQAIGAAVARPGTAVYCIIGDGAMGFHLQDIETAVRHRLPIIFLVCCDRQWGMVKLTERIGLDPVRTILRKKLGGTEEPAELPWKNGALTGVADAALQPVKKLLAGTLEQDRSINADLEDTSYDQVASAMGALGLRVSRIEQLEPALEQALEHSACAVIHVDVDSEKHLWAPGLMHFKAMHQEPAGR